jgi:hypothetical protein
MYQLVGNHEILKARFFFGQVLGESVIPVVEQGPVFASSAEHE